MRYPGRNQCHRRTTRFCNRTGQALERVMTLVAGWLAWELVQLTAEWGRSVVGFPGKIECNAVSFLKLEARSKRGKKESRPVVTQGTVKHCRPLHWFNDEEPEAHSTKCSCPFLLVSRSSTYCGTSKTTRHPASRNFHPQFCILYDTFPIQKGLKSRQPEFPWVEMSIDS